MNWIEIVIANLKLKQEVLEDLHDRRRKELENLSHKSLSDANFRHCQGRVAVLTDLISELTIKDRENGQPE